MPALLKGDDGARNSAAAPRPESATVSGRDDRTSCPTPLTGREQLDRALSAWLVPLVPNRSRCGLACESPPCLAATPTNRGSRSPSSESSCPATCSRPFSPEQPEYIDTAGRRSRSLLLRRSNRGSQRRRDQMPQSLACEHLPPASPRSHKGRTAQAATRRDVAADSAIGEVSRDQKSRSSPCASVAPRIRQRCAPLPRRS
jgi:hypothetical protein